MDFSLPSRAFIGAYFNINNLSGAKKFLISVACETNGDTEAVVGIAAIKKQWSKGQLKIVYHNSYYTNAQVEGWVKHVALGKLVLTKKGLDYVQSIAVHESDNPLDDSTKLMLFSSKQSHSFDKRIREIFSAAKNVVKIADSYVDESIFDSTLDQIPTKAKIQLMYGNNPGKPFGTRVVRFKQQYNNFTLARNNHLHDRFIIVDDSGFIIGPSLKDAANKSPAILVRLSKKDSATLSVYFDSMYRNLTKL